MNTLFSDRITDVPKSFIREILKVSLDPSFISFAGGLPNRELFPVKELTASTNEVLQKFGSDVLQYSNSEGYLPLRHSIADSYKQDGLDIHPDNILITNGSQQGLDLLGKVLLNEGDGVIIEEPGYLGAIQAFSLYTPTFHPVAVTGSGMDVEQLARTVATTSNKLLYSVPNFQNPSGITYTADNRQQIADIISGQGLFLIEDNPYGKLRFSGDQPPSFMRLLPKQTLLLGSFSKTIVPGFRLGWIVAPDALMDKLLVAKQAADLHTCHFTQYIIHHYLTHYDIGAHTDRIIQRYGEQCRCMVESISRSFPASVRTTQPEGGMFLWATLPDGISAMELFDHAIKEKVVFVPGDPFYTSATQTNSLRLNFSCVDKETIRDGIERLARSIELLLNQKRGE